MWHNDGPTEDVSYLIVLIDWITEGANYDRYRGGGGQAGETKNVLAVEILRLISLKEIKTIRTAKDITNNISTL
ncbi:hypothetical protein JG688_00010526 [Phytophthora aleatoria]|uniref:Uncharacterized protein n=1 Tax=Phytophthora aleatoria TaxID=2496075 RepID=A0A8J5IQ63_9STRA|nr:hypothetical protein JG688_00010526 [Phytophthora aleatoria]